MAGRLRLREHVIEQPQATQGVVRIGDQAVTANLVARKRVLIDEHHIEPGARELKRRRAARRAGAHHDHIALRRQLEWRQVDVERHSRRDEVAPHAGITVVCEDSARVAPVWQDRARRSTGSKHRTISR